MSVYTRFCALKSGLKWLIFSILLWEQLVALSPEAFRYLHSASFKFEKGIPVIRVLVKRFPSSFLHISTPFSVQCDGKKRDFLSATIAVSVQKPPTVRYNIALREISKHDLKNYKKLLKLWEEKAGEKPVLVTLGGIFSIGNNRINNKEYHIAVPAGTDKHHAAEKMAKMRRRLPHLSLSLIPVLEKAEEVTVKIVADAQRTKRSVMRCQNAAYLYPLKQPLFFGAKKVVSGERIIVTASATGKLDIVAESDIERLLYGILPGELFLSAPFETLKAQAVAARTDIFMQLGKRHIIEPFHVCSSIHCQKILWDEGVIKQKFKDAVDSTKGEVLLYKKLYIARAPYSSSSGGHTEDIRYVWFTSKKEYLTGVWDGDKEYPYNLRNEKELRQFLASGDGYDNIKINRRFRWVKQFSDTDMDACFAKDGVGHITDIIPQKRGVSGRIYQILFIGTHGKKEMWGELNIRRKLNNLYSSLFVVDRSPGKWIFTGGGWGHGVGMCQMGAIGMGRNGSTYRTILQKYYPATEVKKLY